MTKYYVIEDEQGDIAVTTPLDYDKKTEKILKEFSSFEAADEYASSLV